MDSRTAILEQRYMHEGEQDEIDVWKRTARAWSTTEKEYKDQLKMMASLDALPNTPAIANAGRERQQGSACFVLPIDDSLNEGDAAIMRTLDNATRVHATGGGTGFSFGSIRPAGSLISSNGRPAVLGPVGWLRLYSEVIGKVSQGGVRWGANMGVLPVDHPDIMEFITCKNQEFDGNSDHSPIYNFNISVGMSDKFMQYDRTNGGKELWEQIVYGAWLNGEPGLLFLDSINNAAPHPERIEATNPCGEVPLLPNEACVLGSVNLANHIVAGSMDYTHLEHTVRTLTRMLDNVVDLQDYPLPQVQAQHGRYRKIGVGIMGLADAFILCKMVYGDKNSVSAAKTWMEFVQNISWDESAKLGVERGYYPGYVEGLPKRRNIVCQVVAPTGTISRLAKCSFGIEPIYAGVQESYILGRTVPFIDKHPLRNDKHFITADEISLGQHIDILTAIQSHTDQAVSKTCNAAENTTPEQVSDALITAYETGAKGITILRKNSRVKVVIKDHSGKHDHDTDAEDTLPEGLDKQQVDCVGGVCEM